MAIVQIKLTGSLSEQRSQDSQQASNEDVEIVKAVTQKATPTETRVSNKTLVSDQFYCPY